MGIAVKTLPPCSNGKTAQLIMFQDTSCANAYDIDQSYYAENNCYYYGVDTIPGVLFACTEGAGGEVATSTTTVIASRLPIAADTAADTAVATATGSTPGTSASSANNAILTSTPTSESSPHSSSSSSQTPAAANNNNDSASSSSGLSRQGQIGIGVALPVAAVVVALLAWWFPCHGKDKFRRSNPNHASSYELSSSAMQSKPHELAASTVITQNSPVHSPMQYPPQAVSPNAHPGQGQGQGQDFWAKYR
ncbi:MAG: hypothetical protein Q9190_000790 [Brigantiaea leucoxantha]